MKATNTNLFSILPRFVLAVLCAATMRTIAADQTAGSATGTISGRVKNAVTGQYLGNARVSVKATNLEVLTDETGIYQLVNVPAGPVTIEIFYTGLDPHKIAANVPAGGQLERNIELTSAARYGGDPAVVKLNPYVVTSNNETDAQALALNEQRFAANIKNVIATDAFGEVLGSNVGEFLKFVPGLTAEYNASGEIDSIAVRGMGADKTNFTTDGAPMVAVIPGGDRRFRTSAVPITSSSRIEVTKVPLPSSPADSMAGSINMVSRSSFEASRAQLSGGVNFLANSENITLKKTPHSTGDKNTRKIRPAFDLNYTLPINKNLGIVLTAMQSDRFSEQHLSQKGYNSAGVGTGASLSAPYMQSYLLQDGPDGRRLTYFSAKVDWRPTTHSVLSVGVSNNRYADYNGNQGFSMNTGNNGTPLPATGVPMSFGPDYTIGATGRGTVTITGSAQTVFENTESGNINYRFDDGRWRVTSSLNYTNNERTRPPEGAFVATNSTLVETVRVSFIDVTPERPGRIRAYNNNNVEIDIFNPANYRLNTVTEGPLAVRSHITTGTFNVRRRFSVLPFPTALQVGAYHNIRVFDARQESRLLTYLGPDGNATTPDSPVPFLMQVFTNRDSKFGFKNVPYTSANRAYEAWQANPGLFVATPAQLVTAEDFRRANSKHVKETVSSGYVQAEASLLQNRLKIVTGVRFEATTDDGQGPLSDADAVFVRNVNGTFAHNAMGARIRKPEAGAAGSLEELNLTRQERAYQGSRTYDGYYPSLHFTYEPKDNLLLRAAFARTYGRPNFVDVIPTATIRENDLTEAQQSDPSVVRGTISIANTALRPWTADNYDLSFEYYTNQGGLFSAGVFLKDITNFFGTGTRFATASDVAEAGLDERYIGWNLTTKFNAGAARITGAEFNARHSLRSLGRWGSYFTLFGNATKLRLEGSQRADFSSFIPLSGNWGFSFARKRLTLMAKWNYRGLDKRTAKTVAGPDGFQYIEARTLLDLNAAYQVTKRWSLSASAGNVFNVPRITMIYGSETPEYARQTTTNIPGMTFGLSLRGNY